jgi:hypothetical protein
MCAQPDGRLDLTNIRCSTWECFLGSEDWCSVSPSIDINKTLRDLKETIDWNRISKYIVDARLRMKACAASTATKVLIYGYPQWSHGRVYYDLCKHLHERGYILDIINWQENHASYIGELIAFYDLVLSALDGVRSLLDAYGVPYEQIIALSHHDMDMRMLAPTPTIP